MRIAQISPIVERVPPRRYGGTERVVYALTEELVKRGHKVTLFASGNSQTSAQLVAAFPRSLREVEVVDIYGSNPLALLNIGTAYAQRGNFDIIHDHNGHLGLIAANTISTPTVFTLHGAFTSENRLIYKDLSKPYLVSISQAQAKSAPGLNYIGNVYNGLHMNHYPFFRDDDGYLLFVGRISMEKGIHYAIEIALYLNMPLIIAAKLDKYDQDYFEEYVKPKLSKQIRWIGEVSEIERNMLMSRARCFLHPITWKEPFGLTMIEAMACGCPVVAFNLGSVPEIIVNGKTGFIVNTIDEMITAVVNINKIDRLDCRLHALKNFSASKMADGYENIYRKILNLNHFKKNRLNHTPAILPIF